MSDFQLQKIMYRPETASVFMDEFVGIPTIALSTIPQRTGELFIKSCVDYIMARLGVIVLSQFFIITTLIIKMTSNGPVFFVQQRCGLYGRTFNMLKLHTMVADA